MRLDPGWADALEAYARLLLERAIPMGLVAESDRERIVERHVVDSLRAARLFRPEDRLACDIGSGAGLPGIVLAVALPGCRFRLIEPKKRAAAFLELAIDRMGLRNVDVVTQRVEEVTEASDVATARAFGPPERAWEAAFGLLRPGGRLIYFAGKRFEDRQIVKPEPPAEVRLETVIEKRTPLAIMVRREGTVRA
jgi:16S rRNA (guanine527-N7)-methyltransferase